MPVVCVVGPVSPYRGGIAQYTEALSDALGTMADVHVFSFAKQYPKVLYPGATDRDPDLEPVPGVEYSLDATRPLTWRRTTDRIAALAPDVVLFNWWTLYWQPWTAYMARRLRRRGIRTVFICHNIADHDSGRLRSRLSARLLRAADGYIVHTAQERGVLERDLPGRPVLTRPHPVHERFPEPTHAWPPRGRLDILFFGFIRPYKGLDVLLDAMEQLDDPTVALSVVGESWEDTAALETRLSALGAEGVLRYVGDDEAADYFSRADLVVLPYRSATGSAVVSAAFNYRTPVLATRVGGLPDVVGPETGFLVEPEDPAALAATLRTITREQCRALAPGIARFAAENTWDAFARRVLDTFAVDAARDDR